MRRSCLLAVLAFTCIFGQENRQPMPVAAKDFPVMAWGGSPSDPDQLRGMKEAGLNVSGFCAAKDLDKVNAAGLTCFVTDQRINGYPLLNLPPEAEIRRNMAAVKSEIGDHPAVLGYYLRDEPDVKELEGLAKLATILRETIPGKLPYINLFPYHVSAARLGTDYVTYVRMLSEKAGQPFLSYDNYSLVGAEMLDHFYNNLEIVRRVSVETNTPFWNCILANAHFNYSEPSDATFNLQVYSTFAYGGRGIQYFTYFTPQVGNYRLAAIDQFGNRTRTWDMLRRINYQIHALAPTLLKLHSTGVYHYPDVPPQGKPLSASQLIERVDVRQSGLVRSPAGGRILVGEFQDSAQRPYFMLVNKDLSNSFTFKVHLKQQGRKLLRISPYTGREEAFNGEMDWLAPGAGVLFRID